MHKSFALLALILVAASAEQYAVLLSGSEGYSNYRHQSDVCHNYQILIENGVKPENIIVFAEDDIAYNSRNPFQGTLYNKPDPNGPGVNVYEGCVIDYSGSSCSKQNYLAVLTGEATTGGSGRSLGSTVNDNVFMFYSDHGTSGLVSMPHGGSLYADELNNAFQTMSNKRMFGKLTYYLESCLSGSMFQQTNTPNVYGVSAASPYENSYGTYCGSAARVNGQSIGSCLGDEFSCNWMEDVDAKDITTLSLEQNFQNTRTLTRNSNVMQWGETGFTSDMMSQWVGSGLTNSFLRKVADMKKVESGVKISSRDIEMTYLATQYLETPTEENFSELQREMSEISTLSEKFDMINSTYEVTGNVGTTTDFECYRALINEFEAECDQHSDNRLQHFTSFYELCERDQFDVNSAVKFIDTICA